MDVIFASVRLQLNLLYLDDIVVFSRSLAVHIEQVRRVLRLLYEAVVTIKLKKCKFFAETVDYVGHAIRPGRLEHAEHATETVTQRSIWELNTFMFRKVKRVYLIMF